MGINENDATKGAPNPATPAPAEAPKGKRPVKLYHRGNSKLRTTKTKPGTTRPTPADERTAGFGVNTPPGDGDLGTAAKGERRM